jgi:hypothetical protein
VDAYDRAAELLELAAREQATTGGPLARSRRNARRISGATDAIAQRIEDTVGRRPG